MNDKPSMWERIKSGTKGFFSHAIGYLPRGVALTGLIFAGSAALEGAFPGTGFLGISEMSTPDVLNYGLRHLAFGSVISGVIGGGSEAMNCPCPGGNGVAPNTGGGKATESTGIHMAKTLGETCVTAATEHVFTGSGLPATAAKAAIKTIGIGT